MESAPRGGAPRRTSSESFDRALLARQQRREQRHVARAVRRLQLLGIKSADGSDDVADAKTCPEKDKTMHPMLQAWHSSGIPRTASLGIGWEAIGTQDTPTLSASKADAGDGRDRPPSCPVNQLVSNPRKQTAHRRPSSWTPQIEDLSTRAQGMNRNAGKGSASEKDKTGNLMTALRRQASLSEQDCTFSTCGDSPNTRWGLEAKSYSHSQSAHCNTYHPKTKDSATRGTSFRTDKNTCHTVLPRAPPSPQSSNGACLASRHPLRRVASARDCSALHVDSPPLNHIARAKTAKPAPVEECPPATSTSSYSYSYSNSALLGTPTSVCCFPRSDSDSSPRRRCPTNRGVGRSCTMVEAPFEETCIQMSDAADGALSSSIACSTQEAPFSTSLECIGTFPPAMTNPKVLRARSARHQNILTLDNSKGSRVQQQGAASLLAQAGRPSGEADESMAVTPRMERARSAHFAVSFGPPSSTCSSPDSTCSSPGVVVSGSFPEGERGHTCPRSNLAPIEVADPTHEDIWARYGAPWRHRSSHCRAKWSSKLWLEAVTRKLMRSRLEAEGAEAMAALNSAQQEITRRVTRGRKMRFSLLPSEQLLRQDGCAVQRSCEGQAVAETKTQKEVQGEGDPRVRGETHGEGDWLPEMNGEINGKGDREKTGVSLSAAAQSKTQRTSFSDWCSVVMGAVADEVEADKTGLRTSEMEEVKGVVKISEGKTDGIDGSARCRGDTTQRLSPPSDMRIGDTDGGGTELEMKPCHPAAPCHDNEELICKSHCKRPSFSDWAPDFVGVSD